MAAVSFDATVVAAREQVSCDLGGEEVILGIKAGAYYGLDPVGSRIWQLVQQPTTPRAIHARLLEEFEVEPERCEQDLLALLADLAGEGLLEVSNGSAG